LSATDLSEIGPLPAIELRPMDRSDVGESSRVLYDAFREVHDYHRFPGAYPTLQFAAQLAGGLIDHPLIWGVAALSEGRIVGSNFIDERGPIRGVGPTSVDPQAQARGVGRRLTEAVLERGADARGVRLLQDSFNRQSLALYASLGFEVREPTVVLAGRPRSGALPGFEVRPLEAGDVEECERLCVAVHGFERTAELRDALRTSILSPFVAVRDERITAYATTLSFYPAAHAVATTEDDMRALILGALAAGAQSASFLLPTRQGGLLRWCLSEGLRIVKPMTYMTVGEYREPAGCWIPSVSY
jgi:GNAT superfamily N-acetyltransferase